MRPLEKLLESERAAGLCDLEATPSGKAMHDRVWARTQASIMNGRGTPESDAPGAASPVVGWGWKTIAFAALVLAAAPAVVSFATKSDVAAEIRAPSSATVVAEVAPPSSTEGPSKIESVSIDALPSAPPQAKRARAPLPSAAPGPAAEADQLDLERRLLDQVRRALATRDYASAGATLRTYESTFGAGQLAEEEQSLKIRWLAASGQGDAARELAARFKDRFPNSFFRPAVESAIRGAAHEGSGP